jgi:vanillate/3-O-methylgallate O-demethylase
MQAYREWLPERSFEAMSSLGGSYVRERVEDYYFTPWDLDYGRHVKFDHEFIGRSALESMASAVHRRKVTLVWDPADVLKAFEAMMLPGLMPKFLDVPAAYYASFMFDTVQAGNHDVGVSISPAYSANERAWLSLAVVDARYAQPGTHVTLTWGEPDAEHKSAATKPNVERHRQIKVGATVQPWPISTTIRTHYRSRN